MREIEALDSGGGSGGSREKTGWSRRRGFLTFRTPCVRVRSCIFARHRAGIRSRLLIPRVPWGKERRTHRSTVWQRGKSERLGQALNKRKKRLNKSKLVSPLAVSFSRLQPTAAVASVTSTTWRISETNFYIKNYKTLLLKKISYENTLPVLFIYI